MKLQEAVEVGDAKGVLVEGELRGEWRGESEEGEEEEEGRRGEERRGVHSKGNLTTPF